MIAVHRCDNLNERSHGFQLAALERGVREAQRLGQPRYLQVDILVGRVELAPGDGGIDLTPDRPNADLSGFRDLLRTVAGREELERALAPGELSPFCAPSPPPVRGRVRIALLDLRS
jgi:hypothetical protein